MDVHFKTCTLSQSMDIVNTILMYFNMKAYKIDMYICIYIYKYIWIHFYNRNMIKIKIYYSSSTRHKPVHLVICKFLVFRKVTSHFILFGWWFMIVACVWGHLWLSPEAGLIREEDVVISWKKYKSMIVMLVTLPLTPLFVVTGAPRRHVAPSEARRVSSATISLIVSIPIMPM